MSLSTVFHHVATRVRFVFLSFDVLSAELKLLFLATIAPLITLMLSPVLYRLLLIAPVTKLPEVFYTILFSLSGLIVFNFIFFIAIDYLLSLFQGKEAYLSKSVKRTAGKLPIVCIWSLIGALIGTGLDHLAYYFPRTLGTNIFFEAIDIVWWLINLLTIPALIEGTSLFASLWWAANTVIKKFLSTFTVAATFLLYKFFIERAAFFAVLYTPHMLSKLHMVFVPTQDVYSVVLSFIQITGLFMTALISIVMSSVEFIISAGLYLYVLGNPVSKLERNTYSRALLLACLVVCMFVAIAFFVSTGFLILSSYSSIFRNFSSSLFA